MNLFINKYCIVRPEIAFGDGFKYEFPSSNFESFAKNLYAEIKLNYPKFFKMDNLSKLGFITSELLLQGFDLHQFQKEEIGVVIANSNASNDVDNAYFDTVKDESAYYPSPALFVYTLPNIMIGEICIKNKIYGENGFFISKTFDELFVIEYIRNLFEAKAVTCCIVGWVDYQENDYNSFLFLVTQNEEGTKTPFTIEGIRNILS